MKLYSDAPGASMTMANDPRLSELLVELIAERGIDVAVETGTYVGTGSTRFIAEAFRRGRPPKRFVTMEVNFTNWCFAKSNLRAFPFVDCRFGCSVEVDKALDFIRDDEMLHHHQDHPDIYIDDLNNPVEFYSREVRGVLDFLRTDVTANNDARRLLWDGEGLLASLLTHHRDHNPLIVLDSAGGVGFLEFTTALEVMGDRPYALLLDDIHHIKHIRSFRHIAAASDFRLLDSRGGWALAVHDV